MSRTELVTSTKSDNVPSSAQPEVEAGEGQSPKHAEEHHAAAQLIQRNYRGYRTRRQLDGLGLDSSTRWTEAIKEARYRNATKALARRRSSQPAPSEEEAERQKRKHARESWRRISEIARRAGSDDVSDTEDEETMTEEQRAEHKQKLAEARRDRDKRAKVMDLQYFLEMVDRKHRYGSNLRSYHEEWRNADTTQNFFYWLDHGDGRHVELPTVSREKLEKEQVRYLSREERSHYLVKIDDEGKLCWAKNGERISTNTEYKDSLQGIVPINDSTPGFREDGVDINKLKSRTSSISSNSSVGSTAEGDHYTNHDLDQAKGLKKVRHISAATVLNHLLRGTVKPNTWIFVADTSFRLYIGIKQSGAFQHSSFLNGARIASAGTLKIKNGQLRRLSPLSGHYRTPTSNFRAFLQSLKDNGVDMSHTSISRSYAVLLGLETYTRTRRKFKHGIKHVESGKDKAIHPELVKRREEEAKDKSESAEKERRFLAEEEAKEEAVKKETSFTHRIRQRFGRSNSNQNSSSQVSPPQSPPPSSGAGAADEKQKTGTRRFSFPRPGSRKSMSISSPRIDEEKHEPKEDAKPEDAQVAN